MSRLSFTSNKFYAQIDGFSGSVGRATTFMSNKAELVDAKFSTNLYRFYGGYEILDKWSESEKINYKLYPYAGIRLHDINIVSDVLKNEDLLRLKPFLGRTTIGN